jgi:DNA-binding PadR family transcriptional regulator
MRTKIYSITPKGKESLLKKIEYLANAMTFVNNLVREKMANG